MCRLGFRVDDVEELTVTVQCLVMDIKNCGLDQSGNTHSWNFPGASRFAYG